MKRIKLLSNKVQGNYILMTSGVVKHFPNNEYEISDAQVQLLKEKGIKFELVRR